MKQEETHFQTYLDCNFTTKEYETKELEERQKPDMPHSHGPHSLKALHKNPSVDTAAEQKKSFWELCLPIDNGS